MSSIAHLPCYDVDLFQPEPIRNPFPHYRAIRDLGPAVRLNVPDVVALGRFADVQAALRLPEVMISGQGVAFNDYANAPVPEPNTIRSDGERHRRLRRVLVKPLTPSALKDRRQMLKDMISAQIDSLVGIGEFDGVAAVAQFLPLQAVSHMVGLPEEDRQKMLRWAAAAFNSAGPHSVPGTTDPVLAADLAVTAEVQQYFSRIEREDIKPGSWAETLFDAVDAGQMEKREAKAAISGLVIPSLDTTIYAKSTLLHNLATNPDQWALLKADPSLVPSAVLEGVRHSAVVRWFSRVAVSDYHVGDVSLPAGTRVMLLYGSANRDERHYPEPDRFLVERNPTDQLGWGTGPHMCAGMHLARLEMEVMLEALVERVDTISAGKPVFGGNTSLYGIDRMPMRFD